MGIFYEAEFWVLVAFIIFVALIFNKARKAINDILDRRSETIRVQIEEARQLREEAQATLAEYRRKQRDALKEAEAIVTRARQEADRHQQQAREALEQSLVRRRDQAMDKIAQAEADAVRQVRGMAVDLAIAATRRVIAEDLSAGRDDALVDQGIAELPQKLH